MLGSECCWRSAGDAKRDARLVGARSRAVTVAATQRGAPVLVQLFMGLLGTCNHASARPGHTSIEAEEGGCGVGFLQRSCVLPAAHAHTHTHRLTATHTPLPPRIRRNGCWRTRAAAHRACSGMQVGAAAGWWGALRLAGRMVRRGAPQSVEFSLIADQGGRQVAQGRATLRSAGLNHKHCCWCSSCCLLLVLLPCSSDATQSPSRLLKERAGRAWLLP